MILLSALMLASNAPNLQLPANLTIPNFPINLGTVTAALYTFLYILMEPVAGLMLAPIILGGTAYSNLLFDRYGSRANYAAIAVHIFSWVAQFIGHGAFEGRAPALLDNLVQALFLAPFFVWFEILFFLGYRPELKSRLDKAVKQEVKNFNADKKAKASSGAN